MRVLAIGCHPDDLPLEVAAEQAVQARCAMEAAHRSNDEPCAITL